MQIELPSDADAFIKSQAAAAGFGEDISAYVAHLINKEKSEQGANGKSTSDPQEAQPRPQTLSEALAEDGLLGKYENLPSDLSTNPKYMEDFGR